MAQRNAPPTGTHDVRQAAYRGTQGDVSSDSGVPRGRDRDVPSQPMPSPHARTPQDHGEDRSGRSQPNLGQAGTYGATGEHAGGAHGKAATPGGYHEDDGDAAHDAAAARGED
ncbi:hypothetical protein [Xanthomonas sacchari]|uniref:Uncharacterized protein n=1 Tax=Xanthomonas sacchari TaxID=56458 RepID=A0A2P5Z4Q8_9XANT|nr:hypothetical protein [Xanthomonas sacchari]MDV0436789.1 hypothetical protein [Xanthomonas sacchari]PPU82818.1 hypothetical protein XsacCFBP4641_09155 [Xanthomonas sacchari]